MRPVIEFLLAQGNALAGWRRDAFSFDQGGEGYHFFAGPINAAHLRERFAFPASIRVYDDGPIKDSLNRGDISQALPRLVFSFEGLPALLTQFKVRRPPQNSLQQRMEQPTSG